MFFWLNFQSQDTTQKNKTYCKKMLDSLKFQRYKDTMAYVTNLINPNFYEKILASKTMDVYRPHRHLGRKSNLRFHSGKQFNIN